MIKNKIVQFLKNESHISKNIDNNMLFEEYIDSLVFVKLIIFVEETWNINIPNDCVNYCFIKNIEFLSNLIEELIR